MSDNGYVYILMNPSMKDLVKIGKTTREPEERAKELSSTTGVPTPFVVVYDSYFESCSEAEKFVHSFLENKGFRVSLNREFFEIPIKDAIDSIIVAKEHFGTFVKSNTENTLDNSDNISKIEILLEKAQDSIKDFEQDDAISYLKEAILIGSFKANKLLGDVYFDDTFTGEHNYNNAIIYYEKAIQREILSCYGDLAQLYSILARDKKDGIFVEDGNKYEIDNMQWKECRNKAYDYWKQYFNLSEVILVNIAINYFNFLYFFPREIEFTNRIKEVKDDLLEYLNSFDWSYYQYDDDYTQTLKYIIDDNNKDSSNIDKYFSKNKRVDEDNFYYEPDYDNNEICFLLEKAREFQDGYGEELQDTEEAIILYKKAVKLGSILAYSNLGDIYYYNNSSSKDINKALEYYKKATKKGETNCYSNMAQIYLEQNNENNAYKCWQKYFMNIDEKRDSINHIIGVQYLEFTMTFSREIEFIEILKTIENEIIEHYEKFRLITIRGKTREITLEFIKYLKNVLDNIIIQKDINKNLLDRCRNM